MATVKELLDQLSDLPQDAVVLLSLDEGDNDPALTADEASAHVALREEVEKGEAYVAFAEDFGGSVPEDYQEVVVIWAK